VSKHEGKYRTSVAKPQEFMASTVKRGGCLGCNEDILVGDWVAYFEDKLMHADCALDEWALGD
jgi:hypothetical protein